MSAFVDMLNAALAGAAGGVVVAWSIYLMFRRGRS